MVSVLGEKFSEFKVIVFCLFSLAGAEDSAGVGDDIVELGVVTVIGLLVFLPVSRNMATPPMITTKAIMPMNKFLILSINLDV